MTTWQKELSVAVEAAKEAGQLALRYQRGIEAETKQDLSPVTRADREAEELITSILTEAFPGDGVLGEEGASRESRNGRRWIIDPIDGTRDYVRGNPFWATLIGLEADGEVVAGVASFPGLGAVFTASQGGGAFRNGEPIRVSSKSSLTEAVLCFNGFNRLDRTPFEHTLPQWMRQFWAVRCIGGAPDAMLVASGQAEIWIESAAAPWDLAPLKVIAEEAGAVFFNLDGGRSIYGGACVICTPSLEGEVRHFVKASQSGGRVRSGRVQNMQPFEPDKALQLLETELFVLQNEHERTRKLIEAIPLDKSDYRPDSISPSALDLAWHIAVAENRFLDAVASGAFNFEGGKRPDSVQNSADVSRWYNEAFQKNVARLKELTGEQAAKVIDFRGRMQWPAVMFLRLGMNHAIHHRGQLSMYLRPMGAKVPSIYGESYDDVQARMAAEAAS